MTFAKSDVWEWFHHLGNVLQVVQSRFAEIAITFEEPDNFLQHFHDIFVERCDI